MKKERIIEYSDQINDDFAGTSINTQTIGKEFCYIRKSIIWRLLSFVLYYIFALPIVYLISKIFLGLKFENKRILRQLKKQGYFLYGNHTQILDGYIPPISSFPRKSYIIAGPDVVSLPGIRHLVMMLGAIPIPTEISAFHNFVDAISIRYKQGACIAIYPEAHIWPYYTGIRPFSYTSFYYPVKEKAPVVAMVTTYRKRKGLFSLCKRPGITITFSDIMLPNGNLSQREAQKELRDKTFFFMDSISKTKNEVCFITYKYNPQKKKHK